MPARSKNPRADATAEELAYLAGVMDGEGCIDIYGYSGRWSTVTYRLDVKVGMAEPHAVLMLQSVFGGSIQSRARESIRGGNKPSYQWCVSGVLARECLARITPFLRVKREQAELALEFVRSRMAIGLRRYGHPCSAEQHELLAGYGDRLKALKRKTYQLDS